MLCKLIQKNHNNKSATKVAKAARKADDAAIVTILDFKALESTYFPLRLTVSIVLGSDTLLYPL